MERLDLAGVPFFFDEGPEPAIASLIFRVGIADEAPARRGVSHLVEHLALFPLGRRDHPYNGFVDLLTCVFYAQGDQSELEAFLRDVTASLASLPFEQLDTEKRVLQREADRGHLDVVSRMLAFRYGSRGYGGGVLQELGLRWLAEEDIERWRLERFNAANAVIWMHGPKPPTIELELPIGRRHPPPQPAELRYLSFPAFVAEGSGGVAAAMTGPRQWATTGALSLAQGRLHERLRIESGLAYEPWSDYAVLGSELAHLSFGADCRDADADQVAKTMLEILDDLAERGPAEDELEAARRRAERSIREDPDKERVALDQAALDELMGSDHLSPDMELDELAALRPGDIRTVLQEALSTLLILAPDQTPMPSEIFNELDRRPPEIRGRRFRAKAIVQKDELLIGDEGLSWSDDDTVVAIPADEVCAIVEGSGGALTVIGIDGSSVEIDPANLSDPDGAIEALKRLSADPFVPSDDERPGWVKRLAEEKLGRQWPVREELSLLPDALEPDEPPLTMAEASRGGQVGLLVVTPRRVLFLYSGLRKDEFLRFPRNEVRASRTRLKLLGSGVELEVQGQKLKFTGITPRARADEIVDLIRKDQVGSAPHEAP